MSRRPSTRALGDLAALLRTGWSVQRVRGPLRVLEKGGRPDFVFAFHDGVEIGPVMLSRIARHTGLTPGSL